MKNKLFLFTLILGFAFGLITFTSCGDDDEVPTPSAPCQDNENIIVDGNRFKPYRQSTADGQQSIAVPYTTIVKGDGKYLSIAAASILAKTYRDDFMMRIHEEFPQYHWNKNKGYPAKVHREAIRQFGTTPYHRMSFNLLGNTQQLEFDFG